MFLETKRLYLRELTTKDEELIFALDSDSEVMKYLTDGVATPRDDVRMALKKTEELFKKHVGRFGFWAAHDRENDEFLGWFHFRPAKSDPDNTKRVELGYRLHRRFWGRGYASEGGVSLLEKGFTELGVEEVFAITMQTNSASRRVMEKIGLEFVREFFDPEYPNSAVPEVEYAIKGDSWLKRYRA